MQIIQSLHSLTRVTPKLKLQSSVLSLAHNFSLSSSPHKAPDSRSRSPLHGRRTIPLEPQPTYSEAAVRADRSPDLEVHVSRLGEGGPTKIEVKTRFMETVEYVGKMSSKQRNEGMSGVRAGMPRLLPSRESHGAQAEWQGLGPLTRRGKQDKNQKRGRSKAVDSHRLSELLAEELEQETGGTGKERGEKEGGTPGS